MLHRSDNVPLLTRHEVARLLGLRALQLSHGATPAVSVDAHLRGNTTYIAAMELSAGQLDAKIYRADAVVDVRTARLPPTLYILLDTFDGGSRCMSTTLDSC